VHIGQVNRGEAKYLTVFCFMSMSPSQQGIFLNSQLRCRHRDILITRYDTAPVSWLLLALMLLFSMRWRPGGIVRVSYLHSPYPIVTLQEPAMILRPRTVLSSVERGGTCGGMTCTRQAGFEQATQAYTLGCALEFRRMVSPAPCLTAVSAKVHAHATRDGFTCSGYSNLFAL